MASIINAATSGGLISTADTSGILQLQTASTTAVTVDASQNVGVGTASPYAKIQGFTSSATLPVGWVYRSTQGSGSAIPTTFGYPYLQIGAGEFASSGTAIQTIGFGYVSANGNFPPAEIGINTTSTSGQTLGDLVFATRSVTTNTAATEKARITSGGDLFLGVTSAAAGRLAIKDVAGSGNNVWLIGRSSDGTSSVSFRNNADTAYNARIECFDTGVMTFGTGTSATERARITSGGSLCVGRTSNIFGTGAGLCVEASSNSVNCVVTNSGQSALSAVNTAVNTGTSCSLMSFNVGISGGGSQVGTVTYNGTVVQYNSTSDQRLKKNIVDAGSGLAKLANVKIRAFDWIEHDNHTDFGVVAQELVTVAPEAVSAGDTGETIERTWAVDTSTLVPAMIKAIQEQQALIQSLKARLDAANL